MYSMDDGFGTPLMYQDIGSMSMRPMQMPFGMGLYGGGFYNPSYLGGVRMQPQLDNDKFVTMRDKENQDKSVFKTALKVLGVMGLICCIGPVRKGIKNAGGLTKYLENSYNSIKKMFTGKTAKTAASPASTTGSTKTGFWTRMRNIFKKKPATTSTS